MKPRASLAAAVAIIVGIAAVVGLVTLRSKAPADVKVVTKVVSLSCPDADMQCFIAELLKIQSSSGSKVALDTMGQFIADKPQLLGMCHTVLHSLGEQAWRNLGDITKVYQEGTDQCSSAFLHGALVRAFDEVPETGLADRAKTLCQGLGQINVAAGNECTHGIGHAIMVQLKSFDRSAVVCESLTMNDGRGGCLEGLMMEYSSTFPMDAVGGAQAAIAAYKSCLGLKETVSTQMCIYTVGEPSLRSDGRDGDAAPSWKRCVDLVPTDMLTYCARGLGKGAPSQMNWDPLATAKICSQVPSPYGSECVLVAVQTLTYVVQNAQAPYAMCDALTGAYGKTCQDALPEIDRYLAGLKQ